MIAETARPTKTDLDVDNFPPALEVEAGLDPNHPDTDRDGVADGERGTIYGTDPLTAVYGRDGPTDCDEHFAAGIVPSRRIRTIRELQLRWRCSPNTEEPKRLSLLPPPPHPSL